MKRRVVIGAAAAAGAAVAAGLYRFTDLFVKHYPPTPYDDVLAALVDREEAARLGALVGNAPAPAVLAARLRQPQTEWPCWRGPIRYCLRPVDGSRRLGGARECGAAVGAGG